VSAYAFSDSVVCFGSEVVVSLSCSDICKEGDSVCREPAVVVLARS
jgi:hypothetical protein